MSPVTVRICSITFNLAVPEMPGNPENIDCFSPLLIYFSASFLISLDIVNKIRETLMLQLWPQQRLALAEMKA